MTAIPSAGTQAQRWMWLFIVFCAPLFVMFVARWILSETIETQLISYDFFAGAPSNIEVLEGRIPASLILSLYRFGCKRSVKWN